VRGWIGSGRFAVNSGAPMASRNWAHASSRSPCAANQLLLGGAATFTSADMRSDSTASAGLNVLIHRGQKSRSGLLLMLGNIDLPLGIQHLLVCPHDTRTNIDC